MRIIRSLLIASSIAGTLTVPAFAGVTVSSPANGTEVPAQFTLTASSDSCSSQNVAAMGYSFDNSSNTTIIQGGSINGQVESSTGNHVLHVKSWGAQGASCVTDVSISVQASSGSASATSIIPSGAASVSNIQSFSGWQGEHDNAGPGWSSGSTWNVSSPSLYGNARTFVTQYSNAGDERYWVTFSDNTSDTNFFYDAWVYVTGSAQYIANLEMDVNQVMANGNTVLIGVQCDGYSGTWDYTANEGSASNPKPAWVNKWGTNCNPRDLPRNTWHHVQASFSRDDSGNVTYNSVWLDGVQSNLNATVFGAASLGWSPTILTQFQVDGLGSGGTSTVYLDNLTVSYW
jgi:hypothetical protein